jgi:hypothetical protein
MTMVFMFDIYMLWLFVYNPFLETSRLVSACRIFKFGQPSTVSSDYSILALIK